MRAFAARLLLLVLLVLGASSSLMLITSVAPGDAVSEDERAFARDERRRLGLDRPLLTRYGEWLARIVRLDLGESIRYRQPVAALVATRAANTALLATTALVVAAAVALPLGVIAGSGRWPLISSIASGVSIVALSLPPLLTSLVFATIAARTGWLPTGGMSGLDAATLPFADRLLDQLRHLTLPTLALALPLGATLERLQSAVVAEARHERHVLAARGLGLPFSRILVRDLWRPTVAPVAGLFGLAAGSLLSGSLAVEIVTSWPGLGRLMFEALSYRDAPLAAGCAAAAAVFLAVWNTIADVVVWWLDPRTRAEATR